MFLDCSAVKNLVTWQTPYTPDSTTMTTLRKTNLSANPPTQLASKSLKGCKVLAGLGELSLLHAFTHIVMNEGTLGIPHQAQVQQQNHRSRGQGDSMSNQQKSPNLYFTSLAPKDKKNYMVGWSSQPEVANKQNWQTQCSQKQNRLSRCQEKLLVRTLETIATCTFSQNQLSSARARTYRNIIYNARSNRNHPPTSPNTAPGTKNDSHYSSHMKCHLQYAGQQDSPSTVTKYGACHEKWLS